MRKLQKMMPLAKVKQKYLVTFHKIGVDKSHAHGLYL